MTTPGTEPQSALPLEELELTPQWVKAPERDYSRHAGGEARPRGRDRGDRPPRERRPFADQPAGQMRGPKPRRGPGGQPHGKPPGQRSFPPGPPPPAPVEVTFLAEEQHLATMLETIKHSPRTYPLFDLAKLILNKPERHQVRLARPATGDGARPPLWCVPASGDIFLDPEEALRFVFSRRLDLMGTEHKTPIDPPKGSFAFVNRCGLTGVWLGPPNYHEYQARLVRHHQARLAHLPFEQFKARIQTIKDPEAVKAWLDAMSVQTEYECRLCAPPPRFGSREELEKHARELHRDALITASPEIILSGPASRQIGHRGIAQAVRQAWESERRFPLKTVNQLRPLLQRAGLHFFKHPSGVTYISRAKLKRFEAGQELTDRVRRIIEFIRASKKATGPQLLATLAPEPASDGQSDGAPASNEKDLLLTDLHWLMGDGYVVELADGKLWVPPEKAPPPPPPETTPPAVPTEQAPLASEKAAKPTTEPPSPESADPTSPTSEPTPPAS